MIGCFGKGCESSRCIQSVSPPLEKFCLHGTFEGKNNKVSMALTDYLPILIFGLVAGGLALALLGLSHLRAKRSENKAKVLPYECGFDPLEHKLPPTNVRFYLVGLLFIIFDVEVVFLFPWAVTLGKTGQFGFFSMALFLGILTIGFIYEWVKGALNWT